MMASKESSSSSTDAGVVGAALEPARHVAHQVVGRDDGARHVPPDGSDPRALAGVGLEDAAWGVRIEPLVLDEQPHEEVGEVGLV